MLMKRWFIVHKGNIWQWIFFFYFILFQKPKSVLIRKHGVCRSFSRSKPTQRKLIRKPVPNGDHKP